MPDYTSWPTPADVLNRLRSAHVTLRGSEDGADLERVQDLLAAVAEEVEHTTKRQWVADAEDTTRYYDGSGSPLLEVDEIVSLTEISVIGGSGEVLYDVTGAALKSEIGKPKTCIVVGRGSLPAYATSAVGVYNTFNLFPAGRQNIAVTGRFGYGETIPADLWEAVCGEVAVRATREALFAGNDSTTGSPAGGRIIEEKYGDETRKYSLDDGTATGWHNVFCKVTGSGPGGYRRPQGPRLRRLRGSMID